MEDYIYVVFNVHVTTPLVTQTMKRAVFNNKT
jgi:hypothetical protein